MRANLGKILRLIECMADHFYADDTLVCLTDEEKARARERKKKCTARQEGGERCGDYTHCFSLSLIV